MPGTPLASPTDVARSPRLQPAHPRAQRSRSPRPPASPARLRRRALLVLLAGGLAGCGRDPIVHAVDEAQANVMLVALEERGLAPAKEPDDDREGGWIVSVPSRDAAAARRVLSERDLPRTPAPGLAEVFGKPGMVPTPLEERARYLHALSGELARSVEAIDGVAEARVHLALAPDDPLRAEAAPPPRAAVLVKVRAGQRPRVEPMVDGMRSLVAGAVAGLDAATVSVVLSEAAAPPPAPARPASPPWRRAALLGGAFVALVAGGGLLAWPYRDRVSSLARRV
jgi:type III secretion protein J